MSSKMQVKILAMLMISFVPSVFCANVVGQDWPRFRGVDGAGVAENASLPSAWSANANLGWKTELPGPGASCPIIVGDKIFVTCYTGYGLDQADPGDIENLHRHLLCFDVKTGEKLWQKDVKAALPEDPYTGVGVPAHGYASHTPVSDGKHVFAFFGKSGVFAFDMDGNQLWQADVGKESDPTKWGSSSSPIVYQNMVIVVASAESQSVIALDKSTGEELWRQEAKGLDGMWGTPTMVKVDEGRTDIVMCVAKELWGLNPENGELRWYADATGARHAYTSILTEDNRVFAFTGRGGGSVAVDVGGSGDISETHTAWIGRDNASFATPVKFENRVYLVTRNILNVIDAETGENIKKMRLKGAKKTGGRFGTLDYPSPLVADGKLFYMNGSGQMYVFKLDDELTQLNVNQVTQDKEIFWGTPAISGKRMIIRSSKHLYCVTDKGETVTEADNQFAKGDQREQGAEQREGGRGGRGGNRRRFDPEAMFTRMDTNEDGVLTEDEYSANPAADRLKTLDKDENGEISKEEFTSNIRSLFQRRGRGQGQAAPQDSRPDRPQRPKASFAETDG